MEVGKVIKRINDFFFVFAFFFFFAFKNDGNMFSVYQNGNFLPGRNISHREKIRKSDFAPSEGYACYAPPRDIVFLSIFPLNLAKKIPE